MPEFLRPGVFIIETSFRGKPIEGVATSTAGFVGRAKTGPVGKPTLVTSYAQFVREFGDAYSTPQNMGEHLAHSVSGFFANGGLRAYVVRVLGAGAATSTVAVRRGNVVRLPASAKVYGGTAVIPVASLRGVAKNASVEIYTRTSPTAAFPSTPKYSANVSSYDALAKTITLDVPLPATAVLDPENTYIVLAGAKPPAAPAITFSAVNKGKSGDQLSVLFRAADLSPVRLQTKKLVRAKPLIGSGLTGPAAGADTITNLTADQARMLRNGDTVRLDNGTGGVDTKRIHPTTGIGQATFTKNDVSGAAPNNYTGDVVLLDRGAGADLTNPIRLFSLNAYDFTAAALNLPHGAAAMLKTGDKLSVGAGVNQFIFTIQNVTLATSAKLESAVAANHTATTVTLIDTADATATDLGRLVVADVADLQLPLRRTAANLSVPEPIVVTDGVTTVSKTVILADPATNSVYYSGPIASAPFLTGWTSIESLHVAAPGSKVVPVASTAGFYSGATVKLDDGSAPQYSTVDVVDAAARTITLKAAIGGTSFIDVNADPDRRTAFLQVLEVNAFVYQNGALAETFSGLSWNSDSTTQAYGKYYVNRINDERTGSALVTVSAPAGDDNGDIARSPITDDGFSEPLVGGDDGAPPTNVDLIGTDGGPGNRTGIQALGERDDIAIVSVPGVTDVAVQQALITHCELLKYRFAVLDGQPGVSDVSKIQAHRNNYDTKYAAYYLPWLQTLDITTGNTLLVPPSGHVMGIYARSDNERGVHKAPANEVVRNIQGVELPFGNGEQEVLNPVGINLIRELTGRGVRVWGGRTLSSDSEWRYVNVRRLFIYLEHSIDIGTQWVVFEPNNEELWARVKSTIESFLFGVWKTGALMGTKPEDGYFVKVDRTTMTQDDIDNGRLVCLIGVAPTYPAEFVIFKIGQFTATPSAS